MVSIANSRGPDTLAALATEMGARAVAVLDTVKDVEVVVVTIAQESVPLLPKGLFKAVPESVVVVDTGNDLFLPKFRICCDC